MAKAFFNVSIHAVTILLFLLSTLNCSDRNIKVSTITVAPKLGELSLAVTRGNLEEVQRLVSAGVDINENIGTPSQPITPLMLALYYAGRPNETIASYLLDQGADPDVQFKSSRSGVPIMSIRDWICAERESAQSNNPNESCIQVADFRDRLMRRDQIGRQR